MELKGSKRGRNNCESSSAWQKGGERKQRALGKRGKQELKDSENKGDLEWDDMV